MITRILALSTERQEQLAQLVSPNSVWAPIWTPDIVGELRTVFQVPAGADLPEFLRRRLVELGREFRVDDNFDRTGDFELARMLVDYLLDVTVTLSDDDDQLREFARFTRTRDPRERAAWLRDSASLRALVDPTGAVTCGRPPAQSNTEAASRAGYQDEVVQLLDDLAAVAQRRDALSQGPPGGVDPVPALASLIGLVAGGLFMAGAGRFGRAGNKSASDAAERRKRAPRSRPVQLQAAVITFVVYASRLG